MKNGWKVWCVGVCMLEESMILWAFYWAATEGLACLQYMRIHLYPLNPQPPGSVHSQGLAAGSPDSNINQLDIWNQPEAPHPTATDAFAFRLSARRLFSLGCQVYTTQSAWRVEWCVNKKKSELNNLGVWVRQKFPSVICQLEFTPGRHFAWSSRITVVE